MGWDRKAFTSLRQPLTWGVGATWLAVAGIAAIALIDGPSEGARGVILAASGAAAAATAGLQMLVRSRPLLFARHGLWLLAAWSLVDLVLIGVVVAVTGGATSPFAYLYALPVLYFMALYPPVLQAGLLVTTAVSFAVAVRASGARAPAGHVALVALVVGLVALLTFLLARELRLRAERSLEAQRESERRAQLLATLAVATSDMAGLDRDAVVQRLLGAATGLGVETAALYVVDRVGGTHRCTDHVGMPKGYRPGARPLTAGLVGRAAVEGRTVTVEDYGSFPEADEGLQAAGYQAVAAAPLSTVGGPVTAVLVAGTRRSRSFTDEEIEAFELLAAHAARALDTVHRYSTHQHVVERMRRLAQLKEDFIATTSHELRTPLTIVGGASELLDGRWEDLDEATRRELVRRIRHHGMALQDTVELLTHFRQLESDRFDLDVQPIHVLDVFDAAAGRAKRASEKDDVVICQADRRLVVHADRVLLERALDCLLDNAVKHTPAGTTIALMAAPADGMNVTISISDDGPGMPADVVERLGQSFARGGEMHTRPTRGMGLGLAVVVRVLRLHSTTLEVTSSADGTTLSFELPGSRISDEPSGRRVRHRGPVRLTASPIVRLDDRVGSL